MSVTARCQRISPARVGIRHHPFQRPSKGPNGRDQALIFRAPNFDGHPGVLCQRQFKPVKAVTCPSITDVRTEQICKNLGDQPAICLYNIKANWFIWGEDILYPTSDDVGASNIDKPAQGPEG